MSREPDIVDTFWMRITPPLLLTSQHQDNMRTWHSVRRTSARRSPARESEGCLLMLRTASDERELHAIWKGTNGVGTNGVTTNSVSFDRGTFWVLPFTYFYLLKGARAYICSQFVKINSLLLQRPH